MFCIGKTSGIQHHLQYRPRTYLMATRNHFFFCGKPSGFQRHVQTPYLMVTALRNPLEVFVSGEQYMYRQETSTLPKVTRRRESRYYGVPTALFLVWGKARVRRCHCGGAIKARRVESGCEPGAPYSRDAVSCCLDDVGGEGRLQQKH